MEQRIIECVPNFSEGRDPAAIRKITDEIDKAPGVRLLDVDPGRDANRTVVTFAGSPEQVVEAAFRAIKKAAEVIDMSRHSGEHPRMGATDVCPLIPVAGLGIEETADYARQLAKRVGEELDIPVYLYEEAAALPERRNLAVIRSGQYEGLEARLRDPRWAPDHGRAVFNKRAGATVIGARNLLVAYNVNLNTGAVALANAIAFDVREAGRVKKENGKIVLDEEGKVLREPGMLKKVKAMGWVMKEYGIAQVSMNLTDIRVTPVHTAFEACRTCAEKRGVQVTGSELVGLIPLQALLDAGRYAIDKRQKTADVSEASLVNEAVKFLGLDELRPFDPRKKVIEYALRAEG